MGTVNVLVVVDALGASSGGSLQNNVYMIDSRKYMGSWSEGQCELTTVCNDSDIIQWTIAPVDSGTDVRITGFTGDMVTSKVCTPQEQGLSGAKYWAGRVEAQGRTGRVQYSLTVMIDNQQMSFDPYLDIR